MLLSSAICGGPYGAAVFGVGVQSVAKWGGERPGLWDRRFVEAFREPPVGTVLRPSPRGFGSQGSGLPSAGEGEGGACGTGGLPRRFCFCFSERTFG